MSWGDSPACVHDAETGTVDVELAISGAGQAEVTVTAYVDEDTSRPVGSITTTISTGGEERFDTLSFPVRRPPYVDIDGIAACSLDVEPLQLEPAGS